MEFPGPTILELVAFPPPGDLPNPEIEAVSSVFLVLAGGFITTELPEKPHITHK